MKKLLIFVVTYKASFRVFNLINKIPFKKLSKIQYKILISDDNSDDITLKYILFTKSKFGSKINVNFNKKNFGYGANIKKCLKYAYLNKFDYAVMLHGDNQYNPKHIIEMLSYINSGKYDAIVGSRMMIKENALKGNMPIYKYLGNIFLSYFFNLFYSTNFTDCHTGFWMYNLKSIKKKIFLNCDNKFCFDLDLRLQLLMENKKIKEIPIETHYGTERSSTHVIYALRFFIKVIKYKIFKKL